MADTLYTISLIANDVLFRERLHAGAAQLEAPGDPVVWVWDRRYEIAAAPEWATKVDYWIDTNPGADPANGWATDVGVISDDDIRSKIELILDEEAPAEEGP